jgi:dipeptidyl aminopeptidase/acylaminoacyl peptidase
MFHYWNDVTPESHKFSFQLLWLLNEAMNGAADFNEVHRAARNIRPGNTSDWTREFLTQADIVKKIADDALATGHEATASAALLRAFTYYRSAERVMEPSDPQRMPLYEKAMTCFRKGLDLSLHPHERVSVPFEGVELDGYFYPPRARIKMTPSPCVVFVAGGDSLPEENFFRGVQQLTERGVSCLVFNGPGQGSSLRVLGLKTRPDYEKPVTAAVDYLMSRKDIDPNRIGILGVSFGGYYAMRAVCFEHRFKACVAWGANYDVYEDAFLYYHPHRQHRMNIAGAKTLEDAKRIYSAFTLKGILKNVQCPVLITHGTHDRMVRPEAAQKVFDDLVVEDKTLRYYDFDEGGAEHCSMENWGQVIPYQVDWLLDRLHR